MKLQLILLFLRSHLVSVNALQRCKSDGNCDSTESFCRNGFCSNPFEMGCLRTMAKRKQHSLESDEDINPFNKRACNSDDDAISSNYCDKPTFDYDEVRIAPGNWESSLLVS